MQRYLGLDVHAASCTLDEIVIAGITESRGQKSDRRDAYGLAEKLRTGALAKRRDGSSPHRTESKAFALPNWSVA